MTIKQVSIKAAQHLTELASIQQCITKMATNPDGSFDSRRYALHKVEFTEALTVAILGVLDSETKSAAMEGKVTDYLQKIVTSLSAREVWAELSSNGTLLLVGRTKKSMVPALRIARDRHQGKLTGNIVLNFLSGNGVIPFMRSSANLEDLVRDVNLIQQNFPEAFAKKAPKSKSHGTTRKSKD